MAWVGVTEPPGSGSWKRSNGVARGTRVFRCENDSAVTPRQAETANDGSRSVPSIGDAYPGTTNVLATEIDVKGVKDSSKVFDVTVQYSSNKDEQDTATEDPTSRPDKVVRRGISIREAYFRDETTPDPKPVTNSAGEPFSSFPERDVALGVMFVINRNVIADNTISYKNIQKTTNAASITIKGITINTGEAFWNDWEIDGPLTAEMSDGSTITYYSEKIEIAAKVDWLDRFDDRGLNKLDTGVLVPITQDGKEVILPYPLDGAGAAKASPTDLPAELTFKPYAAASWAGVSLPA